MTKNSFHTLCWYMAGLACLTWVLPTQVRAADAIASRAPMTREAAQVHDVALGQQGRLIGQFVDAQGQPRSNQLVVLQRIDGKQLQAQTDQQGRFIFQEVPGGVYQIATSDAAMACRCWSDKAAPPSAIRELLIVSGDGVERGQRPLADVLFSGPVLIAIVIAAAIAIPIAVHNSQDAS